MQFLTGNSARTAHFAASSGGQSEEAWRRQFEAAWSAELGDAWKEIAAQLLNPSSREHGADNTEGQAESDSAFNTSINGDALDHMSLLCRSQTHSQDYAEGALMAFNPMPISWKAYTCSSDTAALLSDWSAVRNDLLAGWAALTIEKPAMRDLLQSTARGWNDDRRAGSK